MISLMKKVRRRVNEETEVNLQKSGYWAKLEGSTIMTMKTSQSITILAGGIGPERSVARLGGVRWMPRI